MNKQAYERIVGLSLDKTAAAGGLRSLFRLVKPIGRWMGKTYDKVFPVDYALGRRTRSALNAPVRDAVQEARWALDDDWYSWDTFNQEAKKYPSNIRSKLIKGNNKLVSPQIQESLDTFDSMQRYVQRIKNNPDKYMYYNPLTAHRYNIDDLRRYPWALAEVLSDNTRYAWPISELIDKRLPSASNQINARVRVGKEFYRRPLSKAWHNYIKPTLVTGGVGTGIYGLGKFVYDKLTDPQYTE